MPKKLSIKELLQRQIAELTEKLTESRAYLISYQTMVRQQQSELIKLENALASLDGVVHMPVVEPVFDAGGPPNIFPVQHYKAPQIIKIGDEDVVVEPGFHVEKNSFGEDCIVPDGVSYVPAQEPVATPDVRAGVIPLPAITSGEEFDDPADIISAELPNG